MKKYFAAAALAALAFAIPTNARILYGVTSTTLEEGNGRLVSVNTDNLSPDPSTPTTLTELATVEHANDFMAGTSAGDTYYCYYNTFDQASDLSMQYFGTLDFATGKFSLIAEENHAGSDNVTDMLDMVYDSAGGGLMGLDRQYVPADNKFVSTIQYISTNRGTLSEVYVFDRKYVAICADGEGGYYLATLDRSSDGVYRPAFYHADERFNCTMIKDVSSAEGESSFAHSMDMADGKLWLVTGTVITALDLASLETSTYYLEKSMSGVTFTPGKGSGINETRIEMCGDKLYDLHGRVLAPGTTHQIAIRHRNGKAEKILLR